MKTTLVASSQSHIEGINTPEDLLVYVARVSNPKNQLNTDTGAGLLAYCIKNHHWSVFEQVDFTFEIKTTRAISAQIIRHRSFTYQEYSARYSEVPISTPPELRTRSTNGNRQSSSTIMCDAHQAYAGGAVRASEEAYTYLLAAGAAPETARNVLPMCSPTTIYMKGNLRSWITYLLVRMEEHTQKEHRLIAEEIYNTLQTEVPIVFDALSRTHEVFGFVPEPPPINKLQSMMDYIKLQFVK